MKNKSTQPDLNKWKEIRYHAMEAYGVDEERRLISFEPKDLELILKDVIQVCADMCITEIDRNAILELLN